MQKADEHDKPLITEKSVEAALRYLAETDAKHAMAKAEINALEDLTKTVFGFSFESTTGAVEARKAAAYTTNEYIAHIEKKKQAEIAYFEMDNKRKRAMLQIEVWRSLNANRRQGNIT